MGQVQDPTPVLLIIAASSRYAAALQWARERAVESFGDIALSSPAFDFTETDYYTATMGAGLKKQFFAFEQLVDPSQLAGIKRSTNECEAGYAGLGLHPEPRPLNL